MKPVRLLIIPQNSRLEAWALKLYYKIFVSPDSLQACSPGQGQSQTNGVGLRTPDDYAAWIEANEPNSDQLKLQRDLAAAFIYKPLVSIVTPVYNPPFEVFKQTAAAVIQQTYPHWEWCIADGSTGNAEIRDFLDGLANDEPRIRIKYMEENLGIAANTNAAIALAQGDYVALMDHDDLLAPFALFEVAKALNEYQGADFIYSDEDRISGDGVRRYDPWFRPDFSAEILRSNNYLPHLVVIRRVLGEKVNWLRTGFDGAQDHDLILRVTEQAQRIIHIPGILYHWRAIGGSAALSKEAKPYTHFAGKKAVAEHLERIHRPGSVVDGHDANYHRSIYQLPDDTTVSIIVIVSENTPECLSGCLQSVATHMDKPFVEILVANNSSIPSPSLSHYLPVTKAPVRVFDAMPGETYYALLNRVVGETNNRVLVFLHHDYEFTRSDGLQSLLEQVIWPGNGVCGGLVLDQKKTIVSAGYVVGSGRLAIPIYRGFPDFWPGYFGMLKFPHNRSALSDYCMALRKTEFVKVGGFDTGYCQTLGDVDLCLRVQAGGLNNIWTPYTVLQCLGKDPVHLMDNPKDMDYFRQKWEGFLRQGDPNYSPHLSLEKNEFSIKLPSCPV